MNVLTVNETNDKSPHIFQTLLSPVSGREGGLCPSPFYLSASAMQSAGGDEERQSTGGKLVDSKCWIKAKLDFWMHQTVLQ